MSVNNSLAIQVSWLPDESDGLAWHLCSIHVWVVADGAVLLADVYVQGGLQPLSHLLIHQHTNSIFALVMKGLYVQQVQQKTGGLGANSSTLAACKCSRVLQGCLRFEQL